MSLKSFTEYVSSTVSYMTNGIVFAWGAITFNQLMMLIATIFAVATYFTNLYYKRQQNEREREKERREQELHEQRMQHQYGPKAAKPSDPM